MSAPPDVQNGAEGPIGGLRWDPAEPSPDDTVVLSQAPPQATAGPGDLTADPSARSTSGATLVAGGGSRLRRTRRTLAFVVVGAILLCLGGLASSFLIKSPAERAAETGPPARSLLTAKVERRVVQATVILQGEVVSRQQTTVSPQSASEGASPVITAVRVKPGDSIAAGRVLAEVSARPVITLPGAIPVYRDLKPDDRGADVAQLQAALRGLGQRVRGDVRGYYGAATKAAVKALYTRLGYDALLAGGTDNEELTGAEQGLRQAQRAYDQLLAEGTSGGSGAASSGAGGSGGSGGSGTGGSGSPAGGSGGSAASGTSGGAAARALQLRNAREDRDRARVALARAQAKAGAMVPAGEVTFLASLPARVVSVNAPVGQAVPSNMLVLSSGTLQVKAKLSPYQHNRVVVGQKVTVLSDDTGASYAGVVATVAAAAVSDSAGGGGSGSEGSGGAGAGGSGGSSGGGDGGQNGQLYYPLTITTTKRLGASMQGLTVRVTVAKSSSAGPVTAVPSSAISSRSDGTTIVTVQRAGGALTAVPVTAGVSGDGYVEVKPTGAALKVGDQVVVGR